jgi:hypothetical protein
MTEGNRDPLSSPLSFTDLQQRRSQAMDTAVPGRSETPIVRSPSSLRRRPAVSKASVARCGNDRDKDSVTSDLRLRVEVELSPRVSSFQFRLSTDHRSPIADHPAALVDCQETASIDAIGDANG